MKLTDLETCSPFFFCHVCPPPPSFPAYRVMTRYHNPFSTLLRPPTLDTFFDQISSRRAAAAAVGLVCEMEPLSVRSLPCKPTSTVKLAFFFLSLFLPIPAPRTPPAAVREYKRNGAGGGGGGGKQKYRVSLLAFFSMRKAWFWPKYSKTKNKR